YDNVACADNIYLNITIDVNLVVTHDDAVLVFDNLFYFCTVWVFFSERARWVISVIALRAGVAIEFLNVTAFSNGHEVERILGCSRCGDLLPYIIKGTSFQRVSNR